MPTAPYEPWIVSAVRRGVPDWIIDLALRAEAEAMDEDEEGQP